MHQGRVVVGAARHADGLGGPIKRPLYTCMVGFGLIFLALVLTGTRTEIRAPPPA